MPSGTTSRMTGATDTSTLVGLKTKTTHIFAASHPLFRPPPHARFATGSAALPCSPGFFRYVPNHIHAPSNPRLVFSNSIYSGSATVVDGLPHIIYPGICLRDEWPADARAHYCTNLAVAVPTNPLTDVLLANWSKPADVNPIVNGSSKDPSPAWRTADGAEWRFSDNTGRIYASPDFRRWRPARGVSGLPTGDCPSLQPLPRRTPGAGAAPPGSDQPTHIHTSSGNPFGTWVQAGVYQDGPQGTSGTWRGVRSAAGRCLTAHGACGRSVDRGQVYAATQFRDPVKSRTLLWSWAPVSPNSSMTLLRELTWNPEGMKPEM